MIYFYKCRIKKIADFISIESANYQYLMILGDTDNMYTITSFNKKNKTKQYFTLKAYIQNELTNTKEIV